MSIPPLLHVFGRSRKSTATFAEARPSNHLLTFLSKLKNISTSHTFNLALSRVHHTSELSAPQHLSNFTDISTSHRFKVENGCFDRPPSKLDRLAKELGQHSHLTKQFLQLL
ncbi:uncharacterized protein LOC135394392 [Ornithodoros turicata]|uniref:uncharacterized protein LOC135394392 n=1 Tax=Ornithodoros turicata TaxID=34597 RepID=UPI0031388D8A